MTHRREERMVPMYGANVIIFEGIFAFHDKKVVDLLDMKVFVDTDSDIRQGPLKNGRNTLKLMRVDGINFNYEITSRFF